MLNANSQRNYSRSAAVFAAFALSALAFAVETSPLDWIVAVVNKEPVLNSALQKEIDRFSMQLLDQGESLPSASSLRGRMLTRLVNRELQLQRASELGMLATDAQIDIALQDLMRKRDIASLDELLRSEGVSIEKLRNEVREEITINQALSFDMRAEIKVPNEDIDLLLRTGFSTRLEPELLLRQIQLSRDSAVTAADIRRRAAAGENFAQLASEYSIAPNATKGGALGWRVARQFPEGIVTAVRDLSPGGISEVIELDNGLHIFKLEAIRPIAPGEQRTTEVLVQTVTRERREEINALNERLLSGETTFGEVADGDGGASKWTPIDELPAELGLGDNPRIGEVVGPVREDGLSGVGKWIIVRVVNLTNKVVADSRLRRNAANLALADRFERARRNWIEQLRSIGHVRILREGG